MTTDAAAWYFSEAGGIAGPLTANIDYDRMQNQSPGASVIGQVRVGAEEIIYNTSKKTPLTITGISITGPNASDFAVDPADIASALATVLPANRDAAEVLRISFTPSAEGPRSATLLVSSAAGVAAVSLSGTGLPDRPIVPLFAPMNFISGSAPNNLQMTNTGGKTLSLDTLAIIGPDAGSFTLGALFGHPLGNCFAPMLLGPKSSCNFAVGVASGVTTAVSATLLIVTNDPLHPHQEVPLTFTP
jgi:hypothetical protein